MYRVKCKTCLELFESIAPTKNQECPTCKDKIVCGVEYNGGHWHSREDQRRA